MTARRSARHLENAYPLVGAAVAIVTVIVTLVVLTSSDGQTFVSADDTSRVAAGGRVGAPTTLPAPAAAQPAPLTVDGVTALGGAGLDGADPESPSANVDQNGSLAPESDIASGNNNKTGPDADEVISDNTIVTDEAAPGSSNPGPTSTASATGRTATTKQTTTRKATPTTKRPVTSRATTTTEVQTTPPPPNSRATTTTTTTTSSSTTTTATRPRDTTPATTLPSTTLRTTTTTTTTTAPTTTSTTTTTTTTPPTTSGGSGGGQVVWEENFNSLDTSTWSLEHSTYGDGNNELQCYRPENVSVSGGKLILRAVTERYTCPSGSTREVTSGMIRSRGVTFSPGQAIEFRVKLTPANPDDQSGLWPAVWASGWAGGGWPRGGELDWLEVMTAENPNRAMFSMHYADRSGSHELQNKGVIGPDYFSDAWHTIRFDYGRNGVLVWYLDGQEAFRVEAADTIQGYPSPFDQTISQIKINLALGGRPGPLSPNAVGSTGATFEMDFIRILDL